jgi:ATP-dependent exoDNAse (exonuclease V) alpha subunit
MRRELVTRLGLVFDEIDRHGVGEVTGVSPASQGASLGEILARTDGMIDGAEQLVPVAPGRWSTIEIVAAERAVLAVASKQSIHSLRAEPSHVRAAIEARPSLSNEQRRMVEELCGSGRPVDVVIGRAGAGKTFTLDAVREAFEASDRRVLGISLAARAARELQSGAGITSSTAHTLRSELESGRRRLRSGDVLVIDEAGMLGTQLMAEMVGHADQSGAKVILVGDPKQLPPIEAGGLFASLGQRVDVIELVENRRQRDPLDRFVSVALRKGLTELAVRRLDDGGRITIAHNADALREHMTFDWFALHNDGRDALMAGVHRSDVRDLNARAHELLEGAGLLGPLLMTVDEQRFNVGDSVIATRNRYDLGILNGDIATVTSGGADGLCVATTNGRELRLPLDYVTEFVHHSYARTVHTTQGLTCETALLLGDDALYAEVGYTGLTRGSHENRIYTVVPAAEFHNDGFHLHDLVQTLDHSHAKTAAVDYLDPPQMELR